MAYINYKNPEDKGTREWVQIPSRNTGPKTKEIQKKEDVRGVFTEMIKNNKHISASAIQEELIARGLQVSNDPELTPNGVTVSSAGILIALETNPTPQQETLIEDAIEAALNRTIPERSTAPGRAGKRQNNTGQII